MGQAIWSRCSGGASDASGELAVRAKMRQARWVPLESNPEVFNAFARKAGLPGSWEFVDIYGVDEDLVAMVPPGCVAVTLLFQCTENLERAKEEQRKRIEAQGQLLAPELVYLKQYIGNACGTIACIHCLANNVKVLGLPPGSPIERYLASARGQTPEAAGEMLADMTELHQASEVSAGGGQTAAPPATASVDHHFIAFVEKDGDVYELDGCKAFPINHGPSGGDLLRAATKTIQAEFMGRDPENIHFNMMALVPAMS